MANKIIEAPFDATKAATQTIVHSGEALVDTGRSIIDPFNTRSHAADSRITTKDKEKSQEILGNHIGKIGLVGADADLSVVAQLAADRRLADDDTVVEVRPFVREADMKDDGFFSHLRETVEALSKEFSDVHGISTDKSGAVYNSHPIFVPDRHDPDMAARSWLRFSSEFERLEIQMREDDMDVALLAVTIPQLAVRAFKRRKFEASNLGKNGLVILSDVGKNPRNNVLEAVSS